MPESKLQKLINHERSVRRLGNIAEADAYAKKIKEIKKSQRIQRESQKVSGTWRCSCGFNISLEIDAGAFGPQFAEISLAPHRNPGYTLTKIK